MLPTDKDIFLDSSPWRKNLNRQGLYRGTVVSVDDPQHRGRIQVRVTLLHPASAPAGAVLDGPDDESKVLFAPPGEGVPDDACPWAEPCFPWGGFKDTNEDEGNQTSGFFALPVVGAKVWVAFDGGFTGRPVWLGTWFSESEIPEEITDPSAIRLIKTPAGNLLLFDDATPRILLATPEGTPPRSVRFIELNDSTQTTTIQNSEDNSQKIVLNAAAKTTTIQEGNSSIIIDGDSKTVVVDNAGGSSNVTMTQTQVIISVGSVTLTIDGSTGDITLAGAADVDIQASGDVLLGSGAALGVMLDTMITKYNAHVHSGVTTGPGSSGPPAAPLVPGTDSSLTVKAKV